MLTHEGARTALVGGESRSTRFMNKNALHAAGATGEVRIDGRVDGDVVEVAIEDSGPGVDPDTQRRLFEPLITTKVKAAPASSCGCRLARRRRRYLSRA